MSVAERNQEGGALALHEIYIVELREHALVLIWLGYQRMQQTDLSTAEEDDITGELTRHMDEITQADDAPPWVERYTVKEQIRSYTPDRLGKKRPIVDVEFERHRRGIRPRLRFEAKRLGRGVGVADYLGSEGLGAFLDCYYFYCNRFILSRRAADAAGTGPCERASGKSLLVRCGRARR
jgi:hypothetical protein